MNRGNEETLWYLIKAGTTPRDAIATLCRMGLIASEKQAHATLEKWARQGAYEWGVCLDLGWLTGKPRRERCD